MNTSEWYLILQSYRTVAQNQSLPCKFQIWTQVTRKSVDNAARTSRFKQLTYLMVRYVVLTAKLYLQPSFINSNKTDIILSKNGWVAFFLDLQLDLT